MLVYPFELGCLYVPYPIGRRPKGKALNSLKVGFVTTSRSISLKQGLAFALSALVVISLLVINAIPFSPAQAAARPFPDYDLSFEWIHGQVDKDWKPGDPGDGCVRSAAKEVTPLSHFGFRAKLNPCDGVRTTMKFKYNNVDPQMAPTRDFRLGVTWQYTRRSDNDPYTWKPVENFTMDGEPVPAEKYDPSSQDSVVVKNKDGSWKHLGNNNPRDFFEPAHIVFDDEFHNDEVHTFQWDAYLPADGDHAGMSIGTGSTGDTQGGSIGAKANGLYVSIPASADYRYVLDSEYRAAQKVEDKAKIPNRLLASWSGPLEGSTYTTIPCLEKQQLAPVMAKQSITDIYPELAEVVENPGEVKFQDGSGSYALASYPYEFYVGQPGNWTSVSGLRMMNWDSESQTFKPYGDKNIPYKPTFDSVRKDIPGYTYVDNDLPILKDGRMDMPGYVRSKAPNLKLSYHKIPGVDTQHMYFTYKKNPGTFNLSKQAEDGTALAGAKFELYQLVNEKPSLCGVEPDLTNTEEVTVCPVRTPSSPGELGDMLNAAPTNCETKRVRKVVLEGFNADGSFTTGEDGTFTPAGKPALEPGDYLLREVSAPQDYKILNEYIPFEVPIQAKKDAEGKLVSAQVPANINVKNYKTPPPPTTEPPTPSSTPPTSTTPPTPSTPPTPPLPKTGAAVLWTATVILLVAGAVLTVVRKKNLQ